LLKKNPPQPEEDQDTKDDLEEGESFRANGNEDAIDDELTEDEDQIDERYDRFGGFGGYGRSYSSYGGHAPRGSNIGWYSVADVDPACKSMDRKWRFGPLEFTRGVTDYLYPERQYKRGATMLRYKGF